MSKKSVWAPKIQNGDVVIDPSGDYAQYGAVTAVSRSGMSVTVTTASGQRLAFLATDCVLVQR